MIYLSRERTIKSLPFYLGNHSGVQLNHNHIKLRIKPLQFHKIISYIEVIMKNIKYQHSLLCFSAIVSWNMIFFRSFFHLQYNSNCEVFSWSLGSSIIIFSTPLSGTCFKRFSSRPRGCFSVGTRLKMENSSSEKVVETMMQ